jgi:hypothetical protein
METKSAATHGKISMSARQLPITGSAHKAGIVGNADVTTLLAGLDMTAEGCGAAGLDRRHHLKLAKAEMAGLGRAPGGAMAMENVGNLQRRAAHRRRVIRLASSRPASQARSGRGGS